MARCLEPRDIEEYILGRMSARRTSAVQRHLASCGRCADAVSEANGNEALLEELRAAGEVADLRRSIAGRTAARAAASAGLTPLPGSG